MHTHSAMDAAQAPPMPARTLDDELADVRERFLATLEDTNFQKLTDVLASCSQSARAALSYGDTLLHRAAGIPLDKKTAKELFSALLSSLPESLRANDQNGLTPLHVAASRGLTDNVEALLEAGADAQARCNQGWTPFFWAVWSGIVEVVEMFLQKFALLDAPSRSRAEINGPLLEHRDSAGNTAFMIAVRQGHMALAQRLCERGANIDAQNDEGETALILEAKNPRDAQSPPWLISKANVNLSDRVGRTALYWAASFANFSMVERLLEANAKPDAGKLPEFDPKISANDHTANGKKLTEIFAKYGV